MSNIFDTTSMVALEAALNSVAERQRVTAHNIANVNTPGFRSSRVQFESELAKAIEQGKPAVSEFTASKVAAGTPVNVRGNDVTLELENKDLIEAGLQYEALVNALNHRFKVLGTAINGR